MQKFLLFILTLLLAIWGGCKIETGVSEMAKEETVTSQRGDMPVEKPTLCILVTYDNNPYDDRLKTAWGFSCLVRLKETSILFDTGGDSSRLLFNMKQLEIDPEEVTAVVLSHIHGDHVGGLSGFLKENNNVTVYAPKSFPQNFKDEIRAAGAKLEEIREAKKLIENVYTTGELGSGIIEQSLIVKTELGLVVITGCAHPGIVKIVERAKQLFEDDVLLVMGGFHLGGKSEHEIKEIIANFKKLGVHRVGPSHCSGDKARQLFKEAYGASCLEIGVGSIITIENNVE
jgi:7,8-dihydropterin-6-yl-methyl-4-(beta-D-ribofuranosyl)aminobenzene 5'-phosphate synthase